VAAVRGDTREALEWYEWYERYAALVRDTENGVARHLTLGRAAEAHLMLGRVADAARLADEAIALAEFANAPHFLAVGRRVRGQIWAAQEKFAEAQQAFDAAIVQLQRIGSRLEHARALFHRAALQLAHGGAARGSAPR
jgi:tetratricopeptide (TPR) repeat protein